MTELLQNSERYIRDVSMTFQRYLMMQINWNDRLIGIKGARGTGKTTLLLQYLNKLGKPISEAAYFPMDDLYFLSETLVETGKKFHQQGGKILALDEVHKYPQWSKEIKILYDRYPDLQIIFTGSSIIDISRQEGDLSRRALMYELHGMSYREFLIMNGMKDLPTLSFAVLMEKTGNLRKLFPDEFRPLAGFEEYLKYAYYPFFKEDKAGYYQRLKQMVRLIVEYDMAEIKGFDIRNSKKMMQMLNIIAQQVPFKPNLQKLSEKSHIHRNSLGNYLYYLEEARLIRLLAPSGISTSTLQKPEKIFLNNTNLMYALSNEQPGKGTIRETFVYSQLAPNHKVNFPKTGDFEVDDKFVFEVGGAGKNRQQIKGLPNAYIISDDIEFPVSNAIPMWILGFLY